jgi:hypothetical protein
MTTVLTDRPDRTEAAEYYFTYIDQVSGGISAASSVANYQTLSRSLTACPRNSRYTGTHPTSGASDRCLGI